MREQRDPDNARFEGGSTQVDPSSRRRRQASERWRRAKKSEHIEAEWEEGKSTGDPTEDGEGQTRPSDQAEENDRSWEEKAGRGEHGMR